LKPFIGVPKSWLEPTECTIDGIIAEANRLCNCPDCAQAQASVLANIKRKEEAELIRRLATELSGLLLAEQNDKPIWQKKDRCHPV